MTRQTRSKARAPRKRPRKGILLPDQMLSGPVRRFPQLFDKRAGPALFALRALAQRINDDYNSWLAPFGLTAAKVNYLHVLYSVEGHRLAPTEFSRFVHSTNSNATVMINALESEGLVKRVRDPNDMRRLMAQLTKKGLAKLEEALAVHYRKVRAAMRDVTDTEIEQLLAILVKIADGFDEEVGESAELA